jgi:hypothetical protein
MLCFNVQGCIPQSEDIHNYNKNLLRSFLHICLTIKCTVYHYLKIVLRIQENPLFTLKNSVWYHINYMAYRVSNISFNI